MNQTIWAVQDFIRDEIRAARNVQGIKLDKATLSKIKLGGAVIGRPILEQFLGKSWKHRIETALELRKLDKGGSEENPVELLKATEDLLKDMDENTQKWVFKALMRYQNIDGVDMEEMLEKESDL